ncbi:site-specific integrase [Hymenobacter daecheongensis]|nr:site-specific integrase [Hymenobacter daecheongensis]
MSIYAHGKQIKVYTDVKADPREWEGGEQRFKVRGYTGNKSLNLALDRMQEMVEKLYKDGLAKGIVPTAQDYRDAIEPKEEVAIVSNIPLSDFAAFIERHGLTKEAATVKSLRTTLSHLTRFCQISGFVKKGLDLQYNQFTTGFYDAFTVYLVEIAGLRDSSIKKQLALLKQFLTYATDLGRPVDKGYKTWKWSNHEPEVIALMQGELKQLEDLELPMGHYLNNARALFLLSCYTGLRFSDVEALKPEHDHKDRLRLTTKKTRDRLIIPINPKARVILDNLWAGKVHCITNQKLNAFIKDLALKAGLNRQVEQVIYRAGKRSEEIKPLHELISSHCGRRTFVTLALEQGLPWDVIMKVTGHKQFKAFNRYIQVTEDRQIAAFSVMWK